MQPDAQPQTQTPEEIAMLEKINSVLAGLGSTAKWRRAPKFEPEYQPLKGKKIIMVDDIRMVLENMLPVLMVASDGKAEVIHYQGQTSEQIVSSLMQAQPDIILLDYNLSDSLKGATIARALYAAGFTGKIVGTSSEPRRDKDFKEAGALGNMDMTDESDVKNLAKLIG